MFLLIKNEDNIDLDDFVQSLIYNIYETGVDSSFRNAKMEEMWYNFFLEADFGWEKDSAGKNIVPTIEYILQQYYSNLIVTKSENNYIISSDPEVKINGTNISIVFLANMMNFGTLEVPSYNQIDTVFDYYSDIVPNLYQDWIENNKMNAEEA